VSGVKTSGMKSANMTQAPASQPPPGRDTHVQDGGDLKRYRTETPNLVYELRLTPFELSLYCYLKRVAGAGADGRCFRATERIAEETGMSEGMVSKAKRGLLRADRPGLIGKALIRVEKDDARPGRPRDVITIVDIWPENFLFFAKQSSPQSSPGELQSSPQSSPGELQSSPQSSPGEAKNKTPIPKKEVDEESTPRTLNVGAGQGETVDAPPAEQAPTPNASRPGFENLPSEDKPEPEDAPPAETDAPPGASASGPPRPGPINPGPIDSGQPDLLQTARTLRASEVDRVVRLTGDEGSRRRFEQLYDLAEGAGLLLCWDQARKATHKALQTGTLTGPPGAYFNGLVARLLNEERPALIPTGTRAERRAVAAQARSSLAAAAAGGGGGDTG